MAEDQVFGRGQEAASREGGDDSLPKFTRGPWRIAGGQDYFPKRNERRLEIACLPHSTYDALDIFAPAVGEDGYYAEPSLEEFDATAHLIRTAPEMYDALLHVASIFKGYAIQHAAKGTPEGGQKAEKNREYAKRCEAILAKARGEV